MHAVGVGRPPWKLGGRTAAGGEGNSGRAAVHATLDMPPAARACVMVCDGQVGGRLDISPHHLAPAWRHLTDALRQHPARPPGSAVRVAWRQHASPAGARRAQQGSSPQPAMQPRWVTAGWYLTEPSPEPGQACPPQNLSPSMPPQTARLAAPYSLLPARARELWSKVLTAGSAAGWGCGRAAPRSLC